MSIITLTTDLGGDSPHVGAMHGLIWGTAPDARIVDLTHEVEPGDILSAQVVLENAAPYFPEGTIHMTAVAPLQYEAPRVLVARLGAAFFAGPDNGLITPLLEQVEADRQEVAVYEANLLDYSSGGAEAPHAACAVLAAHLASGAQLEALGQRVSDPVRVSTPEPIILDEGWRGQVVQVDHFGNLTTNIRPAHLQGARHIQITIAGYEIGGLSKTFGDGRPGEILALMDSSNRLSICVVNGSAADRLNANLGDPVEVRLTS